MPFNKLFEGAGGSVLGDLLGSELDYRRNKKMASRQMAFQERMSNTAYQRAVADMRKAGINPIMASKLGGASTPTGASMTSSGLSNLGSKAIQSMATAKQMQLTDAQITNTGSQTDVNKSVKRLNSAKAIVEMLKATNQELQNSVLAKNIVNAGKLSQWQIQYTPFNQAGSQLLDIFNSMFRENPENPNWNRVLRNFTLRPDEFTKMFSNDHPIYQLPKNQQEQLVREAIKKRLNDKNLSWSEFKTRAKQVWFAVFGDWKQ
jgi:hypothetical protein